MSRCFPFPPPGYERKHNPEDLDLLKEAKRKEKKHKKEKKDKERKKDKDKKAKDGSDEKHKDKKDRKEKHKDKDKKEKHKDKKKEKEKEDRRKDKDKSSISEESTVAGKLEGKSGGKLQPKAHSNDRSGFVNEGKSSILFQGQNGGKPSQSCLPSQSNEESKFFQELDRRIRDDQRAAVVGNKDQEMVSRNAIRKIDPQGVENDFSASKTAQSLMPISKAQVEGMAKPVDGQNGRRMEYREKYKEAGVIKPVDKQKDRVKESRSKEKEMKKDENAKIKNENKISSQNQFKDGGNIDPGDFTGKRSTDLPKETNINAANEESIRKRKEHSNGFLHESETRPNKIQRPGPHQLTENGRKPEPFQTPTKPSHAVPNSVDNRVKLMNGLIDSHKPSPPKPKPPSATAASHQIAEPSNKQPKVPNIEHLMAEASRRPPHPDSKYLAEVLAVPTMDWSELDNQEWLFTKAGPTRNVEPVRVDNEDQHVWSEAVHIDSADVCALPYVIPY